MKPRIGGAWDGQGSPFKGCRDFLTEAHGHKRFNLIVTWNEVGYKMVIQKLQAVKLKSFDLKKRPSKGTTMKPRKEGPKCPAG